MKIMPLAEAKNQFSSVIKDVESGYEIAISYGRKKEMVAVIVPYEKWKKTNKRQLGTLRGKGEVIFADDFEMTDEELLNC
jgi:prevent-host-death family protein